MFTKRMKMALVIAGSLLVGGVAAAQPGKAQGAGKPDFQAKKAQMLQKYDVNKDGALDDNERTAMFEARTLERFKKLDTDGNGVLSLAEFKAGKLDRMNKHHARGGKRGMHGRHRGIGRGAAIGDTK